MILKMNACAFDGVDTLTLVGHSLNSLCVPIYEYKCLKNGHIFEVFQTFSEETLKICQLCEGPVEKLVSAGSFQLKGTGWYVTDYKNKAKTAAQSAAQSSGAQQSLASETTQTQVTSGPAKEAAEKKLELKEPKKKED